jgi:hypothetical protein
LKKKETFFNESYLLDRVDFARKDENDEKVVGVVEAGDSLELCMHNIHIAHDKVADYHGDRKDDDDTFDQP